MNTDTQDNSYVDLLARCAIGDQLAFRRLYEQTSPFLHRIAYNILRSDELSNDVLQESFVQIWHSAKDYRVDLAKPLTWMASFVRYRSLDRLALEKRHRDNVDDSAELDELESQVFWHSPERTAQADQLRQQVLECMNTLNERAKTSLTLAYLKGHSRDEIAEILSTNTNTVKSWLHRAAERLKRCIEQKTQTSL